MNSVQLHSSRNAGQLSVPAMAFVATLVLFATVLRGGNRGVALLALELLALAAGLAMAQRALTSGTPLPGSGAQRAACWLLLLSPAWVAGMQWLAGSVTVPTVALHAALAGIPLAVCFLAGLLASNAQAATLRKLWLGVALAQAAFGLTQLSGIEGLFFGIGTWEPIVGTYASKNTYANLLVMAIPLALFQWFHALRGDRRQAGRRTLWGWSAAVFVLVVTVMLTTSRTGIVTGLMVLLFSVLLLSPRRPGARAGGWWWSVGAVALVLVALMAGGLEWATRFDAERLTSDYNMRALMRDATAQAAWTQLPLGTGLGSYPWVSSTIQPGELGSFLLDLAHSDYWQLLMETGLAGALLIAAAFWLYLSRCWAVLRHAGADRSEGTQAAVACGLGLLAFALHAWVDYPFHIPANAMMAATLLGLLCREIPDVAQRKARK